MQPDLQKQYLKAMGITCWEPRHGSSHRSGETSSGATAASGSGPVQVAADQAVVAAALPQACQTPVTAYLGNLIDAPVTIAQQGSGELLLVLEPPALQPAGYELLTAMLNAIDIDIAQQCIVQLTPEGEQSLASVTAQASPAMLVIMAGLGGALSSLNKHRASLHRAGWFGGALAVTIHPQELIIDPSHKRPAWEDLKRVKATLAG